MSNVRSTTTAVLATAALLALGCSSRGVEPALDEASSEATSAPLVSPKPAAPPPPFGGATVSNLGVNWTVQDTSLSDRGVQGAILYTDFHADTYMYITSIVGAGAQVPTFKVGSGAASQGMKVLLAFDASRAVVLQRITAGGGAVLTFAGGAALAPLNFASPVRSFALDGLGTRLVVALADNSVQVFDSAASASGWTLRQSFRPLGTSCLPAPEIGSEVGHAVALSEDGSTLIVSVGSGSYRTSTVPVLCSYAKAKDATFAYAARIAPTDANVQVSGYFGQEPITGHDYGTPLALSGDGAELVVADLDYGAQVPTAIAGALHVYRKDTTKTPASWSEVYRLRASDLGVASTKAFPRTVRIDRAADMIVALRDNEGAGVATDQAATVLTRAGAASTTAEAWATVQTIDLTALAPNRLPSAASETRATSLDPTSTILLSPQSWLDPISFALLPHLFTYTNSGTKPPTGAACGMNTCLVGQVCCNPLKGTCIPPGIVCRL